MSLLIKNNKKKKQWKKNFAFSFLIFSILFLIYAYQSQIYVAGKESKPKVVVVENFEKETDILKSLQEKGIIKNKYTYYTVLFLSKFYKKIEPGGYVFNGNTAGAIHSALSDPEYKYLPIPEGLRKQEVAEKIIDILNLNEEEIRVFKQDFPLCSYSAREGYLAPGEYLVIANSKIQDIQISMKENFEEIYEEVYKKSANSEIKENYSREEIIIVASLIQREAAGKNDSRLISGIIWNRIKNNMPLQIDATLQYVKGDEEDWWPVPESEDKFIESPFNTYLNNGLPPAPISNPGKDAIFAALNPIKTSCLFYIHDNNRNIHCSSTYSGHISNIKSYLR
jgi:UPF0755 protein